MTKFHLFLNFWRKPFFAYSVFWSWNLIFLVLLMYSEIQEQFLFGIIKNALIGYTPVDYSVYSLLIFVIPLASMVLGGTRFLKKPTKLLKLFYGVELPLTLLFILRLTLFRELTMGTGHLFILLFLGMISYLSELLVDRNKTPHWLRIAQKIGHSLLLIIGTYLSLVMLFYAIPSLYMFVIGLFSFEWLEIFKAGFWILLFGLFFLYTSTLYIALPFALLRLYFKAFTRCFQQPLPYGNWIILLTIGLNLAFIIGSNYSQPQTFAFEALDRDFSKTENRVFFHQNAESIKKGLLNAYLSPYRYISSVEQNDHIRKIYENAFECKASTAQYFQDAYNYIMCPFLYNGNTRNDKKKAGEYYAQYFDGAIQANETPTIINALKATWDADGIEAGLLNINQEKVHINLQEIKITELGDIAEIELHEVYQNRTFSRQEIFYYFSLPPNSVLTGLWLSDTDEITKKYPPIIAPRGAAQQVYKSEVQKRVDPSLLEQVGPNQYRLRAFPIDPKRRSSKDETFINPQDTAPQLHLWLTYKTLIDQNGNWNFPSLNEKRNVYWSDNTIRVINNNPVTHITTWLPEFVPATDPVQLKPHISSISDSIYVKITPFVSDHEAQLKQAKIAVLIDGSYSMHLEKPALLQTLKELQGMQLGNDDPAFFIINDQIQPYSLDELLVNLQASESVFFGTNTYLQMVQDFVRQDQETWDAILLISDKGNYSATKDKQTPIDLGKPLYLLHLGKEQTPIYNDAFLETLQNAQGKVLKEPTSLTENLLRASLENNKILAIENGVKYTLANSSIDPDPDFASLAAKAYINSQIIAQDSSRIQQLDAIHSIAKTEHLVTPFSSMIVLVNKAQEEALEKASLAKDRFNREVETGEETLSKPFNPFNVSGTPEPHEWLLIIMAFGFILYHTKYGKRKLNA
jgi:putative PEP-CTERM system integral membrane protein